MILTDSRGVPFERPTPPGRDATPEDWRLYTLQLFAYTDAITDCANAAFERALQEDSLEEDSRG